MNILVTGGAGYIGSHTVVELLNAGHDVVIIDNFSNSHPEVLNRIEKITGKQPQFYEGDVRDKILLRDIVFSNPIDAVMHFAGYKAVGVSVKDPLSYYQNNLESALVICEVMRENEIKKLIFSSTATVYGDPEELPLRETNRVGIGISHTYGRSKYMIEQILIDLAASDPTWEITILRYFNPIGAHESGLIGEDPDGVPNNLLPYVSRVAVGIIDHLKVFGDDYDTPDGTGVRDFIHVADLAKGHLAALQNLKASSKAEIYNLGTGKGTSVLQVVKAFEKATGERIAYEVVGRRAGDIDIFYADASKANAELNWKAEKTVEDACQDSWNWQSQNPRGYNS